MNEKPELYNIKELLNNENKYVIPIYQRNFEWGESEIRQLILDIFDYSIDNYDKDYYIYYCIYYVSYRVTKYYIYFFVYIFIFFIVWYINNHC